MSHRIGKSFIIEPETKKMCEYCGKVEETRPYGRNNEEICFDCAMIPGNKEITEKKFAEMME